MLGKHVFGWHARHAQICHGPRGKDVCITQGILESSGKEVYGWIHWLLRSSLRRCFLLFWLKEGRVFMFGIGFCVSLVGKI